MAEKDLFAPPSPDELRMVGVKKSSPKASSKKEPTLSDDGINLGELSVPATSKAAPEEVEKDYAAEPSALDTLLNSVEDSGRGFVQGATFGGSDELYGLGAAGVNKAYNTITGQPGQDFLDLYRKYQQESEKANLESKERSPWLYGTGNVAGGVATGVATAGGGLLAGAAEQGVARTSLPYLAKLAGQGAAIGAGQSALSSEGNLSSQEGANRLVRDSAIGGALGGILAPVAGYASGKISQKLSDRAAQAIDDPEAQKIAIAYGQGKLGLPIKGDAAGQRIHGDIVNSAKEAGETLLGARDIPSQEIGELVRGIDEIPTGDIIKNVSQRTSAITAPDAIPALAQDQEYQTFKHLVNKYGKVLADKVDDAAEGLPQAEGLMGNTVAEAGVEAAEEAAPTVLKGENLQAFNLALKKLQGKTRNPNVKSLISDTISDITSTIEQHGGEEISGLNSKMKDISTKLPELFTKKQVNQFNSPANALKKIQENIKSAIEKAGTAGTNPSRESAKATFETLKNNLKSVGQQYPEVLEQLGVNDPDAFVDGLVNKGKLYDIYKGVSQSQPGTGLESVVSKVPTSPLKILGFGAKTARGKGYLGAYRAGRISKVAGNIYEAGQDKLIRLTDRLSNAGLTSLADGLAKGIENPNASAKNAILFSIMQNPTARGLVGEMFDEEGGEEQDTSATSDVTE